jgi:hypothetical protein
MVFGDGYIEYMQGTDEIRGVYLHSQLERTVHCNFARDGKYSGRGWAYTGPHLTILG